MLKGEQFTQARDGQEPAWVGGLSPRMHQLAEIGAQIAFGIHLRAVVDELQQESYFSNESARSIAEILARLGWLIERAGTSGSGMQASAGVLERVSLKQEETDRDAHRLDAKVTQDGGLVLEGQDIGPGVEEFWGDSDIEYWVTVDKGFKDTVLLWLVKERFADEFQFRVWLEEKRIPYSKHAY